jgi:hypothetical protein
MKKEFSEVLKLGLLAKEGGIPELLAVRFESMDLLQASMKKLRQTLRLTHRRT